MKSTGIETKRVVGLRSVDGKNKRFSSDTVSINAKLPFDHLGISQYAHYLRSYMHYTLRDIHLS